MKNRRQIGWSLRHHGHFLDGDDDDDDDDVFDAARQKHVRRINGDCWAESGGLGGEFPLKDGDC